MSTSPQNTQQTIEEKIKKFQLLFNTMSLGVTYHNEKGEITDANPAAEKILGLTLNQLQGKTSLDPSWKSIHEDGSEYTKEKHPSALALKTGKPVLNKIMGVINSSKKSYRWIKIDAIPQFKGNNKKPYEVITTFDDITKLKKKEDKLKENEDTFFKVLKNSSDSIIFSRLKDFDIINANEAAEILTGYSLKELKNSKLSNINIWKSKSERDNFFKELRKNRTIKNYESQFYNKKGETKFWRVSGQIILIDGVEFILIIIDDITDIKKSQEEIKKHSDFAFTMTENHPAGIVACNAEGKLVLFNKTSKKWHGIDVRKIPQEKWAENYGLYKPDGVTLLKTEEIALVRAFNGENVEDLEMIIKAKNQEPRYVNCNGAPFLDSNGNVLGALVVMNDITHQKKIEKEIKEKLNKVEQSEFLLKQSGKIAKVGAWDFDTKTLKVRWSDQVFHLHGLPVGEIPSFEKAMSFFIDGDREKLAKAIEKTISKNVKYDLELRFRNEQGEKLWVNTIGYPISNNKGEVIGVRGVIQDITEQKIIRSKIEKSQEMHLLLANNTSDIICLQEPDGTFKYLTPSIKQILGYDQTEFYGKKILNIIHEDDIEPFKEFMKEKILKGITKEAYPFRVRHKNGNYIWLEFLSSPVYKNNEINYYVTSARDITEWVLAKERIHKYQTSLQKLTNELILVEEKQKKDIASNIHDHLSQSLVISKMKINQLKKNSKFNVINEELNFIEAHITDALEKSRKIMYELSPPILYQLGFIEALNWLIENLQATHKINFTLNTELMSLNLNESKSIILYRSIQEVLTNTIKHAKASEVTINVVKKNKEILISVKDNGVGFDTSILNSYQSHSGSGFGLFAVQERIRNIKGDLIITSNIGEGTLTKIFLPLERR